MGRAGAGWVLRCWVHPIHYHCISLVCPIIDRVESAIACRPPVLLQVRSTSSLSNKPTAMSPHWASAPPPMCPLRHCIYIAIPCALTTVLRNLCCAILLHKVFVLMIGSSSPPWSTTCEREAPDALAREATAAHPSAHFASGLLTPGHLLSPELLAFGFDVSARAQPRRQHHRFAPTDFVYSDNRVLRRHLLPHHCAHCNRRQDLCWSLRH